MFKTFAKGQDVFLTWGHHDLASSIRTSGVEYPMFNEDGLQIDEMYSQKKAGKKLLSSDVVYVLQRYWTNSGYPDHILYAVVDNQLEEIAHVNRYTTPEEILDSHLPMLLKESIVDDVFGEER